MRLSQLRAPWSLGGDGLSLRSECCPDVEAGLASGSLVLEQAGIGTARLDVECLLAEVLGLPRWELLLQGRRRLAPEEFARYLRMLERREAREPLAYVLGRKEFWSLDLAVAPGVLVPRPETETLVEAALALWRQRRFAEPGRPRIVELCCGSGAVAVALARELPAARLVATDISWRALRVARANAEAHGVADRISWRRGDLWRAVGGEVPAGSADLVVANPPYIPTGDLAGLMPEVQCEPRLALDGGPDGLALIRAIIATTPERLGPEGALALEIGADQAAAVAAQFAADGRYAPAQTVADLAGRPRVIAARLAGC
jgi:release factor glutamine methyltransferase